MLCWCDSDACVNCTFLRDACEKRKAAAAECTPLTVNRRANSELDFWAKWVPQQLKCATSASSEMMDYEEDANQHHTVYNGLVAGCFPLSYRNDGLRRRCEPHSIRWTCCWLFPIKPQDISDIPDTQLEQWHQAAVGLLAEPLSNSYTDPPPLQTQVWSQDPLNILRLLIMNLLSM